MSTSQPQRQTTVSHELEAGWSKWFCVMTFKAEIQAQSKQLSKFYLTRPVDSPGGFYHEEIHK